MSVQSLCPYGLKSLVECISRATLLSKPADIPNFLVEYLLEVIHFRCSNVNHEAGDKDVSFQYQDLWEEKFLRNKTGTAVKQQLPVATTETSTPAAKCPSLIEIEEFLKTLYSDYGSCNEESVGKDIKAPDRKGFPIVTQPKAATPLKPTPLKVKTHKVSFLSSHKESGRTTDKTSDTNRKPSPISSHPRLTPPRCVVKQSEKMARGMKPAPSPRDKTTKTRRVSSVRSGKADMAEVNREVVPERTSTRPLGHKNMGQLRSRAGPSKSSIPMPEGTTEPRVPSPESTRKRPTTPKVSVPESTRKRPTTPKVSVPESNGKRPTTPKVSVPESNGKRPTTPKVSVPESTRKRPTTPKVSVPESTRKRPTTPKVSVPESTRKRPTTPKVSVPESNGKRPTTPEVSVPESTRKRPTTPKVSVPESNGKRPTTPKVSVPESTRKRPTTPKVSVPESTRKRHTTPKVSIPESKRTKDLNEQESTRKRSATPKLCLPEWTSTKNLNGPEKTREQAIVYSAPEKAGAPRVLWSEKAIARPVGGGQGISYRQGCVAEGANNLGQVKYSAVTCPQLAHTVHIIRYKRMLPQSTTLGFSDHSGSTQHHYGIQ
ncbi:proteoglycan 4-like isoform X2 [Sander lucioperca]|uniref:proteoglycan 4-like isoform X2 n=1 Tax=Sander lucioperca TaxID=283035 RepID=UPI001653B10C|nr:proteoglycan 4-like isoform X2 [Sander lucioperca]